jgi:hypothetical protein
MQVRHTMLEMYVAVCENVFQLDGRILELIDIRSLHSV